MAWHLESAVACNTMALIRGRRRVLPHNSRTGWQCDAAACRTDDHACATEMRLLRHNISRTGSAGECASVTGCRCTLLA